MGKNAFPLKKEQTFVVTGGLGFIGSHFVEKVLSLDHNRVVCVDSLTYASNPELVQEFSLRFGDRFLHQERDIVSLEDLPSCDYLVNFAAETHVDNSIQGSTSFLDTNILGTHNLLNLLKKKKIRHMEVGWQFQCPIFVQISTDEVFGDLLQGAAKEGRVHKPSNPYSATKSAAEQLVVAWGRTYNIPYIITRTTNNYGPRQHPEKLIPRTITEILEGRRVPVHHGGTCRRNWIHVKDNVEAIWTILTHGRRNTSYNISSEEEFSVRDVVSLVAEGMGTCYDDVADFSLDRSGVDERYALNSSRVRGLGWTPTRTLKDSLPELVQYYKTHPEKRFSPGVFK